MAYASSGPGHSSAKKIRYFWAGCNPLLGNKSHQPSHFALFNLFNLANSQLSAYGCLLSFLFRHYQLEALYVSTEKFQYSLMYFINERSEFLCSLSDKSEYERPGPACGDAFERFTSPRMWARFSYSIQMRIVPFKLP